MWEFEFAWVVNYGFPTTVNGKGRFSVDTEWDDMPSKKTEEKRGDFRQS